MSCLPSSLSQFEEAVGHRRGRRCGDGKTLVDGFQDEAAVEAPSEGAEVTRQMFGTDHTVSGQEAVLDVGEHRIRPAEGRVAGRGATGAGNVALVDDARLLGDAAKPLTTVADHRGSGRDAGAQASGFAGTEPAHDLEAGVQRSTVVGCLDCGDEGGVSTSAAPRPFTGALAAGIASSISMRGPAAPSW